jgi:hypothetical protein
VSCHGSEAKGTNMKIGGLLWLVLVVGVVFCQADKVEAKWEQGASCGNPGEWCDISLDQYGVEFSISRDLFREVTHLVIREKSRRLQAKAPGIL